MQNPLKSLAFALEKYPERIEAVPIRELVSESARQNEKRPAYVKLNVPDDVVRFRSRPASRTLISRRRSSASGRWSK